MQVVLYTEGFYLPAHLENGLWREAFGALYCGKYIYI
jgi:hypothetical protein